MTHACQICGEEANPNSVVCSNGCGVGTWNNLKYTKEQAAAAWNTRRQANEKLSHGPTP